MEIDPLEHSSSTATTAAILCLTGTGLGVLGFAALNFWHSLAAALGLALA